MILDELAAYAAYRVAQAEQDVPLTTIRRMAEEMPREIFGSRRL